jgi:hypothetical protein
MCIWVPPMRATAPESELLVSQETPGFSTVNAEFQHFDVTGLSQDGLLSYPDGRLVSGLVNQFSLSSLPENSS